MRGKFLRLPAQSPLVKEQKENEVLEGDMSKFTKYHDEILQPKLEKSKRVIGKLKDALQETGTRKETHEIAILDPSPLLISV